MLILNPLSSYGGTNIPLCFRLFKTCFIQGHLMFTVFLLTSGNFAIFRCFSMFWALSSLKTFTKNYAHFQALWSSLSTSFSAICNTTPPQSSVQRSLCADGSHLRNRQE